jgi:hypothetical protein
LDQTWFSSGQDSARHAASVDKKEEISGTAPTGEPQPKLPEANPRGENAKNLKPTIREPQRKPLAAPSNNTPAEAIATRGKATKSPGVNKGENKTTIQGVVGGLEPDASGNTIHKASSGSEYVVFAIGKDGTATKVYCNKSHLIPEIKWLEGQEVSCGAGNRFRKRAGVSRSQQSSRGQAMSIDFTFDGDRYLYLVQGRPVPSVTQVLQAAGLGANYSMVPPKVLERKRTIWSICPRSHAIPGWRVAGPGKRGSGARALFIRLPSDSCASQAFKRN